MNAPKTPRKVPLVFFRNDAGSEPVRDWLLELEKLIGKPSAGIFCGRSGGGQQECRSAVRWERAFGKYEPIFRGTERRVC